MISSVEGHCFNHYAMQPSVIAIDPSFCIITFIEFTEFSELIN